MAKKIPTTLFSRGTKLMGLASRLAMDELGSRLKTWEDEKKKLEGRLEMARDVVQTLSHLKGASMKLGQLISLDLGEYVPPEIMKVIEQLQNQSTFLPYEQIEKILEEELKEKLSSFEKIQPRPIAAASIGQVHKARLNGKDVVIKIQYPGVSESIPSDLKLLKLIVKQLTFFQGKDVDFSAFFLEVEEVLRKEADYDHELKMHTLYRKLFLDSPYVVPEVFSEYSTNKVLTQEFIQGLSFSEWLETAPSQSEKDRLSNLFLTLYMEELFHFGVVQTDPNPGNFLITPKNEIALLDFGAAKEYSEEFVEGYRQVLVAAYKNDRALLLSESERLGFIDARENKEVKEIYLRMVDVLAAPFRVNKPFDFTDKSFLQESRDLSWALSRKCRYSPPPKDLLFLHRKLVGMFVFIKKLDSKIILHDYWHLVEKPHFLRRS